MNIKSFLISAIAILALIYRVDCQLTNRFLVDIAHFTSGNISTAVVQCAGTVISQRHVITTATCVNVQLPTAVAIRFESYTVVQGVNRNFTETSSVSRVLIHPLFTGQELTNNIALVSASGVYFARAEFTPVTLGELQSNSSNCQLFGWGGSTPIPRRDSLTVYSAPYCNPSYPQAFCSPLGPNPHATCSASQGSPVFCGDFAVLRGFSLNHEACNVDSKGNYLNFHSIAPFRTWIQTAMENEIGNTVAPGFIVNIVAYPSANISAAVTRCLGTIITDRHVLTTSSCVTVDSSSSIGVKYQTAQGTRTVNAANVFTHPNYTITAIRKLNDVAVIKVSDVFSAMPRTLGGLVTNTTCKIQGQENSVSIHGPGFCDPLAPQSFCTDYKTEWFNSNCAALQGSTVTCGNDSAIAGYVTSGGFCEKVGDRYLLNYNSVADFQIWINEVAGASFSSTISVFLIMSAVVLSLN